MCHFLQRGLFCIGQTPEFWQRLDDKNKKRGRKSQERKGRNKFRASNLKAYKWFRRRCRLAAWPRIRSFVTNVNVRLLAVDSTIAIRFELCSRFVVYRIWRVVSSGVYDDEVEVTLMKPSGKFSVCTLETAARS